MRFHLKRRQAYLDADVAPPDVCMMMMDNCSGQNKSNVCMMFYMMLSLLFCKKVVVCYFVRGHSRCGSSTVACTRTWGALCVSFVSPCARTHGVPVRAGKQTRPSTPPPI